MADPTKHEPPEITAEAIDAARRELGLGETATREEIDSRYRALVRRWHPDVCGEPEGVCRERMQRLTRARRLLATFVRNYRYSFRAEDVRRDQESPLTRHRRQFGEDAGYGP